jgi:hypothetical protein
MEDGLQKQVVEQYVVDALSFAEAEQRITEEMSQYISGEFEVADVKKAAYKEVFFDDDNAASDRWYKAKLDFITIDERTEKEKRSRVTYLVQATNLNRAMKNVDTVMGGTMIDYDAASISDTKLVDVFEYSKGNEAEAGSIEELSVRLAELREVGSIKLEELERREKEEAARIHEENRIADLKAYCEKKGLDFETENAKALKKLEKKKKK